MTTPGPLPAMPLSIASSPAQFRFKLAIGWIGDLIATSGKDPLNLEMSCAS